MNNLQEQTKGANVKESILNNNDENTYNSTASIIYFIVLTAIYFILRFFFGSKYIILTILYFLAIIVGEFGINLSISKKVCGTNQYSSSALYTILPWTFIFGLLQAMLNFFPGWLSPFSNTIGYFVVKILGIGGLFNKILSSKIDNIGGIDSKTKLTSEALEHIYNDRSLLINEISQTNFERFWSNMSSSGLFKSGVGNDTALKEKLLSYIKIKDLVAEGVWYMLTGLLIISVSFNLMINSDCNRSVSDIQKYSDIISSEISNVKESTVYKETE